MFRVMASEHISTKRIRNDYEEEEEGKPKKIPRTLAEKTRDKRLIVVLENASLETVKVSICFPCLSGCLLCFHY